MTLDERVYIVPGDCAEPRLDIFLTEREEASSRSQIARAVAEGRVFVDGRAARKAGQRLASGQRVVLSREPPVPDRALPEPLPLQVRHEDRDLVVVAKPSGMVVHPAHGHPTGTLVNALLHHCRDLSGVGGVLRPGIVHRLDRDTSGLLVVAKHDQSHRALADQFKDHRVRRRYLAIVHGGARMAPEGEFRTLFGRHPTDRKRFSSKVREGREAITRWRVHKSAEGLHWLDVQLTTGRTHQIRVHFADHGHPVLGDPLYGPGGKTSLKAAGQKAVKPMLRQALHAYALGFSHPRDGRALDFFEPPPPDLMALLKSLWGPDSTAAALESLRSESLSGANNAHGEE